METRRLRLLVELSRLGSMRAVADTHGLTTSTVSQQLAALAKESGTALLEPQGRRVRLTPAGRRLADHAVRILADVDVDLALTYDYNLAPASPGPVLEAAALWSTPWGLAVPTGLAEPADLTQPSDLARFRDHQWIVNSRNTADEEAVRTLASLAGFSPRITHEIDSLDLVEDLIIAGHGVGLLPVVRPARAGVVVLPLPAPAVELRAFAVTRRGRSGWAPLRVLLGRLLDHARVAAPSRAEPW